MERWRSHAGLKRGRIPRCGECVSAYAQMLGSWFGVNVLSHVWFVVTSVPDGSLAESDQKQSCEGFSLVLPARCPRPSSEIWQLCSNLFLIRNCYRYLQNKAAKAAGCRTSSLIMQSQD